MNDHPTSAATVAVVTTASNASHHVPTTSTSATSVQQQHRGLTDDEIRSIFESLYQTRECHHHPSNVGVVSHPDTNSRRGEGTIVSPPMLPYKNAENDEAHAHSSDEGSSKTTNATTIPSFSIVPCGSHCEKLSPPPYAFPNGLYVLLRPASNKNAPPATTIPTTTTHTHTNHALMGHCAHSITSSTGIIRKPTTATLSGNSIAEKKRLAHDLDGLIHIPIHLQQYPVWTNTTSTAMAAAVTVSSHISNSGSTLIATTTPTTPEVTMDCKWRLSGPQFPSPTAIQQRYCYPIVVATTPNNSIPTKTDDIDSVNGTIDNKSSTFSIAAAASSRYCDCTGGALYTMYSATTGKELLEYRLLHVYYSSKRAGNKGVVSSPKPMAVRTTTATTTTARAAAIVGTKPVATSLPSLTMMPWSRSNKNSTKKKLKRPSTGPVNGSPTSSKYHKRTMKASSTPASTRNHWQYQQHVNRDNVTINNTTIRPYYSPNVPCDRYHASQNDYFLSNDNDRTNPWGQRSRNGYVQQQQLHHCANNISCCHDGDNRNDVEYGTAHRSHSEGAASVYIPSSPADDFTSTTIGVIHTFTPSSTSTAIRTGSNNNVDLSNHTSRTSNNAHYNYYSQSPSPFRCPIRMANPPINIRNISPLYSTGINAIATLNELDQYSELNLSNSPSMSSTCSSLSMQQLQDMNQRTTQQHRHHHWYSDFDGDDDGCSIKTTAIRPYGIDTILSFPNDPFQRTSRYDDFDDMIVTAGYHPNPVDASCTTKITAQNNIPFDCDLLWPSTLSDATTANHNTIVTFQSTLDYVQERIREHIVMSLSSSSSTSSSNGFIPNATGRHNINRHTISVPMQNDDESVLLLSSSSSMSQVPAVPRHQHHASSLVNIVTSWAQHVAQNPI